MLERELVPFVATKLSLRVRQHVHRSLVLLGERRITMMSFVLINGSWLLLVWLRCLMSLFLAIVIVFLPIVSVCLRRSHSDLEVIFARLADFEDIFLLNLGLTTNIGCECSIKVLLL